MRLSIASDQDDRGWKDFVDQNETCVNYHRWDWKSVIEQAFGWKTYYLIAKQGDAIQGILPLAGNRSFMFGNVLCSLPFFSEAGIASKSPEAADVLASEAIRLGRETQSKYIELRHAGESPIQWAAKRNKVTLVCDVFADPEENLHHLPTKMRTNVRRALKSGLEAQFGGNELLGDFYEIFCRKMRELGTPVYSKTFFESVLRHFPNETFVCRILHAGKAVSAAFLTGYKGTLEANWSASLSDAMALRPNMFLFWQLICFAGQKGYRVFDFGRSSVGSGTYEFKLQWNTRVIPLHWNYWSASGEEALELNPNNPRYRAAIWVWKRLPLSATKLIGPPIARCLP